MGAGHRPETVRRQVEGNQRRLAAVLDHGARGGGFPQNRMVERRHAFRQIGAEAADMADRKRFGGGVHGQISIDDAVNLGRRYDRPRRGTVERHGQFRLPPQQRKHGDHQSSAIGGQNREREFDGVRQLDGDDGIRRQSGFDEMRSQRGDDAVGLRVSEALRRLARDAQLVGGIDQRQRIRLPGQRPLEQRVERGRGGGLAHGVTAKAELVFVIWVARPVCATTFPANSRLTRWSKAVLSDSIARSIAPRR